MPSSFATKNSYVFWECNPFCYVSEKHTNKNAVLAPYQHFTRNCFYFVSFTLSIAGRSVRVNITMETVTISHSYSYKKKLRMEVFSNICTSLYQDLADL